METQNRRYRRVDLRKDVMINGSIRALGLDLSLGGLYVHTGRQFKSGSIVTLTLPLNNESINVKARVQRSEEGVGMGVCFLDVAEEKFDSISSFIDERERKVFSAKKMVMLVDGNQTARRINKSRLVLDGLNVIEAADGAAALALLEKEKVELIVLDLTMEIMDGFKVLSIISQKSEWSTIPVLVLSARSSAGDREKALKAGAKEFLVKMMTSPAKLSERVKIHLANKK